MARCNPRISFLPNYGLLGALGPGDMPASNPPWPQQERVHVRSIGLVPMSTPGQIVDLSFPQASSVNDGIDSAVQ